MGGGDDMSNTGPNGGWNDESVEEAGLITTPFEPTKPKDLLEEPNKMKSQETGTLVADSAISQYDKIKSYDILNGKKTDPLEEAKKNIPPDAIQKDVEKVTNALKTTVQGIKNIENITKGKPGPIIQKDLFENLLEPKVPESRHQLSPLF